MSLTLVIGSAGAGKSALLREFVIRGGAGIDFAIHLVVHQGADACWWIVAWWADGCQLYERYFTAPLDAPERVVNAPSGAVACSWELVPLMHECGAWERQVLHAPQPSYLAWSKDVLGFSDT